MSQIRAFLAIDLDDDLKPKINKIIKEFKGTDANIKYVELLNLHFTLKFFGDIDVEGIEMLSDKIESSVVGDCRFCGTRSNPSVRGSYSGLSENNFTPADFAYATLDGMASELFDMYSASDKKASGLVCSGNGIRKNAALRRIVSEKFGCDIKIPFYEEEAAYGAALSATVAAGISSDIADACSKIKYKDE